MLLHPAIPEPLGMDRVYAYLMAKYRHRRLDLGSYQREENIMIDVSEAIYDNSEFGVNPEVPVTGYKYIETSRLKYIREKDEWEETSQKEWAGIQTQKVFFKYKNIYWQVVFGKHNEESYMDCSVFITRNKAEYNIWVKMAEIADKKSKDISLWW